jgi:hypothetical protein
MNGPWVVGALAQNVWSFAGEGDRPHVNQFLVQPFVNYNLPEGWSLTSSPTMTLDWTADSGDQWTVPLGGGFSKVFKVGEQAMKFQVQAFYNVVKPDNAADWSLQVTLQFLFPK